MKLILAFGCLILTFSSIFEKNNKVSETYQLNFQDDIKNEAFRVLTNKCNSCHSNKKRQIIFTKDNMNSLSKIIDEQVFIKKKMPKGKKNKLTSSQENALILWIESLN